MSLGLALLPLDNDEQSEAIEERGTFTTVVAARPKRWAMQQAALLLDRDEGGATVIGVGLVTRSFQRIATGKHRLRYKHKADVDPLSIDDLIDAVPKNFGPTLAARAESGGDLTVKSAAAVIKALAVLRPGAQGDLRQLMSIAKSPKVNLGSNALQVVAHEADSVRLALDIADIPRDELHDCRADGVSRFVERLADMRAAEDTMISYDGSRFLDFSRVDHPSGVVQFAKNDERLTIVNVNRGPVEKATGADLIYINETIGSFVLVQYKVMRREGETRSRLVYRPDAQLAAELERMRAIKAAKDDKMPGSFRLDKGCCFLKFCKPIVSLDYSPRDLVSGMYLPLRYYDVLATSAQTKGPKGGTVLSFDTVGRHIDNTLFVSLVRGGWIGSRGPASARLTNLVLEGLAAHRSVTVASSFKVDVGNEDEDEF
jgi:hypothetical protein